MPRKTNFAAQLKMKIRTSLIVAFTVGMLAWSAGAQSVNNSPGESAAALNLALVATPSSSHVSGDTSVGALNDGMVPRNSRDDRHGAYGNWPENGTQWVQYDWDKPISTAKMAVYWWADGAGVHLPKAARLLYWEGQKFVPVHSVSAIGVLGDRFNETTFGEVTTTKLRMEIDSEGPRQIATGILEWRVFDSGKSPHFPPSVTAGVDRDVIIGGKTYLQGSLKSIYARSNSHLEIAWSVASGPKPSSVKFADSRALTTTATFSTPGQYTLKLVAHEGDASAESTLLVKAVEPPPKVQLDAVYTRNFRINNPLWASRTKALIVNWIPHCIDEINNTNLPQGGIDNFMAAGHKLAGDKNPGRHKGYPFSNAWVHQTVEAICIALMIDPQGDAEIIQSQKRMQATLDEWIPIILAAQEPDGYLQTRFTLDTRGAEHWSPRTRSEHEGYVAGYFLESATNHYQMTNQKDSRMYNAAKKLADCWCNNLGPAPKKPWFDGHQEMEQALVRFGRFVNDVEGPGTGQKYIELARFLLDSRTGGSEYDQSHLPVVQQYEAVGHAVRAVYTYSGMADVAVETHDVDYQSAVISLWDNIVNKKYYVTGGVGSGETSEGFGPNYSLRNNAYCESCSSCGEIFFQYKLNLAYQDSKYADLYEETLYNALLGSTDLEGKNFYYTNPLEVTGPRTAWHGCPCCVGNIPRTLLMLPTWMYARSENEIYVNLFVGSTVRLDRIAGTEVELVQETDYPWSGKVALTVNPVESRKFSVKIRMPNRGVSSLYSLTPELHGLESLTLNGEPVPIQADKGYATITRRWKRGDKLEFTLPMAIQRVKASDKIKADQGRVALRYGPLLYNIESVDQNVDSVLATDAPLATEWRPDLLGGLVVIQGKFENGNPLLAIPHYARDNRRGASSPGLTGGDPSIDYSGASGGVTTTSTNASPGGRRINRERAGRSLVWLRDQ